MEMLGFGKYQRASVKQGKCSILHWLWITAAVPCLLLSSTSWAGAVLALPCQGSSQESGLSSPPVCGAGLCHLGYPWRGFAKGSQGKTIPLWLGWNTLHDRHLQGPWKILSSLPGQNGETLRCLRPADSPRQRRPGLAPVSLRQSSFSPAMHLRHWMNFLTASSPAPGQPAWSCSQVQLPGCGQV